MKRKLFCSRLRLASRSFAVFLGVAISGGSAVARAGAPDWLERAAAVSVPDLSPDTEAVVLLDETDVVVEKNGDVATVHRRALRILRAEGKRHATIVVGFGGDTLLRDLVAWEIPRRGKPTKWKEKDAVVLDPSGAGTYTDRRFKALVIAGAAPGSVVGFEWEMLDKHARLDATWEFQGALPVLVSRLHVELPRDWSLEPVWINAPPRPPAGKGERSWNWEITDVPPIRSGALMPASRAVAARMALRLDPGASSSLRAQRFASWDDVGRWFAALTSDRREVTPALRTKVEALTAGSKGSLDRIRALATFAQREIRYVALELGGGNLQPRRADEVLTNRIGDCKDKATLVSAMLHSAGIESFYVVINSERGATAREFPSLSGFDHVILAIRLPDDVPRDGLSSTIVHPVMGGLLFFDPTSEVTPLGELPAQLQGSVGLLVTEKGGELLELPLAPAATNERRINARLALSDAGDLNANVRVQISGAFADAVRNAFLEVSDGSRKDGVETSLREAIPNLTIEKFNVENVREISSSLAMDYELRARGFASHSGDHLYFRRSAFAERWPGVLERPAAAREVEFPFLSTDAQDLELALPEGFVVDEIPAATDIDAGFASFTSRTSVEGNLLRFHRVLTVNQLRIPAANFAKVQEFFQRVVDDDRRSAVIKASSDASRGK